MQKLHHKDLSKTQQVIIRRMFEAVDALDELDDFDFAEKDWYHRHEWTPKQEKLFIDWLDKWLGYKNIFHTPLDISMMMLQIGWKTKEDECIKTD